MARTSRAAVSRTYRVPHHEHLALRWHALSRYGGTHSRATAARTLALRRHALSRYGGTNSPRYGGTTHISRTASRTSRATVARTLALQYQGCPRYGNTNVRAIVARTSSQRLGQLSRTQQDILRATIGRAIVMTDNTNPAKYFTCDKWPGNCHDRQYKPSKIFYARQLAGQLSRRSIRTQQDILRATITRATVTTVNTNPARYFTRDNCPANCYDRQYETSKVLTVL